MFEPINLTPAERLLLKKVCRKILKQEPLIKAIIYIGTLQTLYTWFLFILIDRKCNCPDYDLNELIEHTTGLSLTLFVIIERADIIEGDNGQDRQFLNYALARGLILYQANDLHLEKPVSLIISEPERNQLWKLW